MGRSGLRLITLAAVSVLALSACNSPSPTATVPATQASASQTPAASSGSDAGTIRWFVGVDALGTADAQIAVEKAFVASYNKMNGDHITIKLEVQPNATASEVLKTEMALGNSPDIIGPMGVKSRNGLEGLFLDLTSEIKNNNVDLSVYDSPLVKFFQQGDQGQIGIPYDISPGYIWYNKDIFTKAGLPGLPTKIGEQYQGQTWDWKQLGKVAAQLTLDKTGKKSTDTGFDAKNIVQYGIDFQGLDARRVGSLFGATSIVADGRTSQFPTVWNDALNWYYSAIWAGHYAPDATAQAGTLLGEGNSQSSGHLAMNAASVESISSIATDAKTSKVKAWDVGIIPTWNGITTSPIDADTFSITKASKNPDAAFKAILAIMADASLMKAYGREPARKADRTAYFASLDATLGPIFPGNAVTWSVLDEMAVYPAIPSPDSNLPALSQATSDIDAFYTKLQGTGGLDVKAELTKLQGILQDDYDAVQPLLIQ